MFLSSLHLRQFRGYAKLDLTFAPRLNLFIGPNGSGKSNLLESVSVLATGQSHRGAEAKHLIQWEKDAADVKGHFDGEDRLTLESRQKKGRPRQVLLNNHLQKRSRDWIGRVPVVSFSPDDLNMVKGEPSLRRRAVNGTLCQVDPVYWEALQRYAKVVEERNAALRLVRDGEGEAGILEPWDASLLKEGTALTLARRDFVAAFSERVARWHAGLSSGREEAALAYRPSFLMPEGGMDVVLEANRRRLRELREGETALGSSLIGPHRDDVEISLNGSPARAYASQGQQRTLALAFKLAERELLTEKLGRQPLCLLDDMLSELDPPRRENLVSALAGGLQCLITLTDLSEWPGARDADCRTFLVREGRVEAA